LVWFLVSYKDAFPLIFGGKTVDRNGDRIYIKGEDLVVST